MNTNHPADNFVKRWRERMAEAQRQPTAEFGGSIFQRIRYGDDYPGGKVLCRDCGVKHGQLHVIGCCVERCARCRAQALDCSCIDDPHRAVQ